MQQTVNVRGMNASQVSPPPPFWAEMVPPREVSPHCPPRPPEDVLPRRKVPNLRCAFRQPRAQVAIKPLKRGQCDQGTDPVAPGYRAERRSTCPRTYTPHPTVAEVPAVATASLQRLRPRGEQGPASGRAARLHPRSGLVSIAEARKCGAGSERRECRRSLGRREAGAGGRRRAPGRWDRRHAPHPTPSAGAGAAGPLASSGSQECRRFVTSGTRGAAPQAPKLQRRLFPGPRTFLSAPLRRAANRARSRWALGGRGESATGRPGLSGRGPSAPPPGPLPAPRGHYPPGR